MTTTRVLGAMTPEQYAKLEAKYFRLLAKPLPKAKPKPTPVLTVPVSDKLAVAVRANPESVRVHARDKDGVWLFEGPQRNLNNITVKVALVG